jgi:hypothetical protein
VYSNAFLEKVLAQMDSASPLSARTLFPDVPVIALRRIPTGSATTDVQEKDTHAEDTDANHIIRIATLKKKDVIILSYRVIRFG